METTDQGMASAGEFAPVTQGIVSVPEEATRTLRIEPSRGWVSLRLRELWEYRELLFFLVCGVVVTIVILLVARLGIDVVEDDADDSRSGFLQHLPRTPRHLARTLAPLDDEQHAVRHRRDEHAVGEGSDGRRVYDDVGEDGLQETEKLAHLFRAEQLGSARRRRAG